MGYKDPEAKKAYNKAYYEANKARLNADRIITDLKNYKQRCVRPNTLLKYDEAFNDNRFNSMGESRAFIHSFYG
jgi:hypothetical protein